jgi:hypothetical protein
MSLGLGISLIKAGGGAALDPDVRDFIDETGATEVSSLNRFVKGLKKAGVWSDTLFYTLRFGQNYGSGTQIQPLGGIEDYQNYYGSLINGPQWPVDSSVGGMQFTNSSSQYIEINETFASGTFFSLMTVAQLTPNSAGNTNYAIAGFGIGRGASHTLRPTLALNDEQPRVLLFDVNSTTTTVFDTENSVAGDFHVISSLGNATSAQLLTNNNQFSTNDGIYLLPADDDNISIGANQNAGAPIAFFNGLISFVLFSRVKFTPQQHTDIYNLYKSTLGQGLGLP